MSDPTKPEPPASLGTNADRLVDAYLAATLLSLYMQVALQLAGLSTEKVVELAAFAATQADKMRPAWLAGFQIQPPTPPPPNERH